MRSHIVHLEFDHDNYILRDHKVHGVRIIPGVTYLDLVLRVARELFPQNIGLSKILFTEPLATTQDFNRSVEVQFEEEKQGTYKVRIRSQRIDHQRKAHGEWTEHMQCLLDFEKTPANMFLDIRNFISGSDNRHDVSEIYAEARKVNIEHGEFMQTQGVIYQKGNEELMVLNLSDLSEGYRDSFIAHPAFLDGSTFATSSFSLNGRPGIFTDGVPYIPFSIDRFEVYRTLPSTVYVYSKSQTISEGKIPEVNRNDVMLYDEKGEALALFKGLTNKRIRNSQLIEQLIQESFQSSAGQTPAKEEKSESSYQREVTVKPIQQKNLISDTEGSIKKYLRESVGRKIGRQINEADDRRGFYDIGLDSKQTIEIVRELEAKCSHDFYPTLLFEYQTIEELSAYLLENDAKYFAVESITTPPVCDFQNNQNEIVDE